MRCELTFSLVLGLFRSLRLTIAKQSLHGATTVEKTFIWLFCLRSITEKIRKILSIPRVNLDFQCVYALICTYWSPRQENNTTGKGWPPLLGGILGIRRKSCAKSNNWIFEFMPEDIGAMRYPTHFKSPSNYPVMVIRCELTLILSEVEFSCLRILDDLPL